MTRKVLHKIILYNYLYKFSSLEDKIKKSFKEYILSSDNEKLKNSFILLHLSDEIKTAFCEDIQNDAFQIKKKYYRNEIKDISFKWNLKKCLEFAKENSFLNEIVPEEIDMFQKREKISVFDFLKLSIQLRNSFAHETFEIKNRRELELLSDEKLEELASEDKEFNDLSGLKDLEPIYKHGLTYYFYLNVIEIKLVGQVRNRA